MPVSRQAMSGRQLSLPVDSDGPAVTRGAYRRAMDLPTEVHGGMQQTRWSTKAFSAFVLVWTKAFSSIILSLYSLYTFMIFVPL